MLEQKKLMNFQDFIYPTIFGEIKNEIDVKYAQKLVEKYV